MPNYVKNSNSNKEEVRASVAEDEDAPREVLCVLVLSLIHI